MKHIKWLFCEIADRTFPLLALCGFLLSTMLLGNAPDARHVFWALCALGLSGVAMWAFWSK